MRKRRWTFCLVLIACFCAATGGIYGYLSARDEKQNTAFIGENTIEPEESFEPPSEIKPGSSFLKEPSLKNTGNTACYVRMFAECSDSRIGKFLSMDFNGQEWTEKQADGYYYYKLPLEPGETAIPLFTRVTVSDEAEEDALEDFEIIIYGESIQKGKNQSYTEAWKSDGMPQEQKEAGGD